MRAGVLAILVGCAFVALARAGAQPEAADAIAWLFRTPPDQARAELRLTSVDASGRRTVVELTLRYSLDGDVPRLAVSLAGGNQSPRTFCLRCGTAGALTPCATTEGSFPASADEMIPGTLLPWRELTFGLCREFAVLSTETSADRQHEIFVVAPKDRSQSDDPGLLHVFLSHATHAPEKIVRLDAAGALRSTLDIHEIRRTAWGRAVVRSTWTETGTGARVLIELRGGSVGAKQGGKFHKP